MSVLFITEDRVSHLYTIRASLKILNAKVTPTRCCKKMTKQDHSYSRINTKQPKSVSKSHAKRKISVVGVTKEKQNKTPHHTP